MHACEDRFRDAVVGGFGLSDHYQMRIEVE